jgi:hypothetical protein
MTPANLARHRTNPNMPFWTMLKEGNDHFEVTHMEPKVDVCDRHYVFDAQQPADSTKPLVFSPSARCPAYEVAAEIAGPALEKQRNDEYQIAQLTRLNTPVAPIVMGTDGGMNRVFVAKLAETQPIYDNDGHIHAPPIHPGMPPPTISGPREDPEASMKTASVQKPSLFGGLFDRTTTQTTTQSNAGQVASANTGSNSEGFFARLFKPKGEAAPQPAPQGTTLAGLKPVPAPRKVETAKVETPKSESQKVEPQKAEAAAASRTQAPQVASAAPSAGLLVPAGSFEGRWAGLQ